MKRGLQTHRILVIVIPAQLVRVPAARVEHLGKRPVQPRRCLRACTGCKTARRSRPRRSGPSAAAWSESAFDAARAESRNGSPASESGSGFVALGNSPVSWFGNPSLRTINRDRVSVTCHLVRKRVFRPLAFKPARPRIRPAHRPPAQPGHTGLDENTANQHGRYLQRAGYTSRVVPDY